MSAQAAADLRAARELISDPERWTVGYAARDEHANPTSPMSKNAKCFCAIGAIQRVTDGSVQRSCNAEMLLYAYIEEQYPDHPYISHVNDKLGHEATLDMFDKAAALAEASD